MTTAPARDHALTIPLGRLERLMAGDGLAPPGSPRAKALSLVKAVLRLECIRRGDRLKELDPGDPALVAQLGELLERANYRPVAEDELDSALRSEALSAVRIEVDLGAYEELRIHARGRHRRTETIRSFWGLRRRRVEFEVLERVFVASRLRGEAAVSMKLFRNVPVPDIEMILPNSSVRMRRIDQAVVFLPAIVSVVMAASKVLLSLTAIWGLIRFWAGLADEHPVAAGGWGLVAAGSLTLLGITMGAWTKYQKRRLQYANTHARLLYFQTLDSEAGAFLRVLDEAFEEEAKEAMLAYAFLAEHGPGEEGALDARIEEWLRAKAGIDADFEVDDALAKLGRLGIARRDGDVWVAADPAEAERTLRAAWDAAAAG